ncbi:MAG: hypothetical protein NT026_02790 [Candidatus Staskawiczbacteria bacterium]|nr:hypothetical protein [Candidatus Staskawiczbacteria bacterium]
MKFKYLFFGLLFLGLAFAGFASAQVCPVCVVAIGAGLGLSRWFGIDDVVTSIWIGALLTALIIWTLVWMKNKKLDFPDDGVAITLSYVLLTYIPLYYAGIVGHPLNKIFGLDKIIFGSAIGATAFFIGHWINLYLKRGNNGKARFAYQKVVLPVATLLITSLIFYLLILWKII